MEETASGPRMQTPGWTESVWLEKLSSDIPACTYLVMRAKTVSFNQALRASRSEAGGDKVPKSVTRRTVSLPNKIGEKTFSNDRV